MKCTVLNGITKLHIQPIASLHLTLENVDLITRKRPMPLTVRTGDTYNQILRLANLKTHGKQRIGEGLVYEKSHERRMYIILN